MQDHTKFPKHLYSLDLARGIAAFCVVVAHYAHFFFVGDQLTNNNARSFPFFDQLIPFYTLGLQALGFFFTLSGFVFFWLYRESVARRECSFSDFVVARFSRLYPLHLFALLLMVVLQAFYINLIGEPWVFPDYDFIGFIRHLFFVQNWGPNLRAFNGPSGTVSIELGLYLMFFVVAILKVARWQSALLIGFLCFIPVIGKLNTTWLFATSSFFIGGLTFFVAQAYVSSLRRNLVTDVILVLIVGALWVSAYDTDMIKQVFRDRLYSMPLIWPMTILALVVLDTRFNSMFKRVRLLGDLSYSIYMLHIPIQLTLVILVTKYLGDQNVFLEEYALLIYVCLVFGVGYLSYNFLELPARSYIRSLYQKRKLRNELSE